MIEQLKDWFKPPTFEDAVTNQVAGMLNILLLTFAALILAFAAIAFFGQTVNLPGVWLLVIGYSFFLIGLWFIMRRGHIQLISNIIVLSAFVIVGLVVYLIGTIRAPVASAFIIVVILAALLSSRRTTFLITVASILFLFLLLQAETRGWLAATAVSPPASLSQWFSHSALLVTTLLLLLMARQTIAVNLSRNLYQARELAASNRELENLQASLEKQISERTLNAEQAREEAEVMRQAMEEQVWLSTGQALLSDKMGGEQEPVVLANNIIHLLCHYLAASIGALFMLENDTLVLAGRYAYPPDSDRPDRFPLGQSLVGQAALEKRPLIFENLPKRYFNIVSGLGETHPRHLAIIPFLYADQVIGVIELGTWEPLPSLSIQFLERAMPGVAIALHTARSRLHIEELLAQTHHEQADF
jgi:hypothetical protein